MHWLPGSNGRHSHDATVQAVVYPLDALAALPSCLIGAPQCSAA